MIRITAIRMTQGYDDLEHITQLFWEQSSHGLKNWASRALIIEWIETSRFQFYVEVGGSRSQVIVAGQGASKYVRTTPNSTTRDNLLSLPRYSNAA